MCDEVRSRWWLCVLFVLFFLLKAFICMQITRSMSRTAWDFCNKKICIDSCTYILGFNPGVFEYPSFCCEHTAVKTTSLGTKLFSAHSGDILTRVARSKMVWQGAKGGNLNAL